MTEVYISCDIESDGPIPGPNSMLSLGAAAFVLPTLKSGYSMDNVRDMISTFSVNLETLEGATGNPDTMAWWSTQPEAWKACRENLESPIAAMNRFAQWIDTLQRYGRPVFVGYPAGFDFLFVYWYLIRFAGKSPFSFSAVDIKTFAMAAMKTDYRETTKRNMPKRWFSQRKHTHVALDDAIEQGLLFMSMLRENRSG